MYSQVYEKEQISVKLQIEVTGFVYLLFKIELRLGDVMYWGYSTAQNQQIKEEWDENTNR